MKNTQNRVTLFIVLVIAFLDWMGVGLVYPMFSSMLFQRDFPLLSPDCTDAVRGLWLGVLIACMPLAQFFSAPILGALSDRKGRKPVLKITLITIVVGYSLSALGVWFHSLSLLLFSRLVVGFAAGNAAVASAVLADISKPEEKAKNFGLLNMVCGIGFTIGPFLGGKLSESTFFTGGFDKPFLFAALLTGFNFLLFHFLFKETLLSTDRSKNEVLWSLINFKKTLNTKRLRPLFITVFIYCFGWSFYWEFIPVTWIAEYGLSASQVGNFYAYAAGFYALSCGVLIGPVIKRLSAPIILLNALVLIGLALLFVMLHAKIEWLWIYLPVQQMLIAFVFPTAAAMVSNWSKGEGQGEAMGALQSVQSIAFAFSPLVSGVFVGINHKMPIVVGGASMLLAALVFALGNRKEITLKEKLP